MSDYFLGGRHSLRTGRNQPRAVGLLAVHLQPQTRPSVCRRRRHSKEKIEAWDLVAILLGVVYLTSCATAPEEPTREERRRTQGVGKEGTDPSLATPYPTDTKTSPPPDNKTPPNANSGNRPGAQGPGVASQETLPKEKKGHE